MWVIENFWNFIINSEKTGHAVRRQYSCSPTDYVVLKNEACSLQSVAAVSADMCYNGACSLQPVAAVYVIFVLLLACFHAFCVCVCLFSPFRPWPVPVKLTDDAGDSATAAAPLRWNPLAELFGRMALLQFRHGLTAELAMPVLTPGRMEQNATFNINTSTARIIRREMENGEEKHLCVLNNFKKCQSYPMCC